jgi:hypothetical protein
VTILCVTDTHFDENPANEYRWEVFSRIVEAVKTHGISRVIHLGDFVGKKDRFSSKFVNRLVRSLLDVGCLCPFDVLRGNHDTPLTGPAFFEFLNSMPGWLRYVVHPIPCEDGSILLPFADDPASAWEKIDFKDYRAAFIHQTVTGARGENGTALEGQRFPAFPRKMKIYSGDVHVPQKQGQVTYVGCPHPIKFGDDFPCRMLLLDGDTFDVVREIPIETVRKRVVEVDSVDDLRDLKVNPGDTVRVRMSLGTGDVARWGGIEREIAEWAQAVGVDCVAEASVASPSASGSPEPELSPEVILAEYARTEEIDDAMSATGLELLREAIG